MCFSPEASFTAAAILSGMAYASLKAAKKTPLVLLGLIPFIFAIQQFSEGIVWLYLKNTLSPSLLTQMAKFIFLLIIFAFWPFWIPFALLLNEKDPKRRAFLLMFSALGVGASALFAMHTFPFQKIQPYVLGNSIQYGGQIPLSGKVFYGLVVLVPCFISSLRYMWVFGILGALSLIVAELFYSNVFASVWCFFAAIISSFFYLVIKSANKQTV